MKDIALRPRMSEKGYALSKQLNTYVFDVPKSVNKHTVARAVESQFEVKVESVRTAVFKGKAKRTVYKKGAKSVQGKESDIKLAFVTLKEGNHIPIYAAIDKAEEDAKKSEEKAAKEKK